jgi:2',3'-cyclic-nucleotide 2'-phosphodiesterase (5'-nucleotidase family)
MMNQLGYGAASLGNHEFDMGWGTLRLRAREATFPILSANLKRTGQSGSPAGVLPSTLLILARSHLRVGVVGITMAKSVATHSTSRNPGLHFGPVGPALERELHRLRGQGAKLIVVLSHQGLPADRKMLDAVSPGVDILVGGHYPSTRVQEHHQGALLLQARPEGLEVGRLRIPLKDDEPQLAEAVLDWLPWATRKTGENPLTRLLSRFPSPQGVLATNPSRWSFRQTCAWVLDAMLDRAHAQGLQPDLALINRGALRASLPRGEITPRNLFRIAPFDNHLVHLQLSGRQLARLLKSAGSGNRRGTLLWRGTSSKPLQRKRRVSLLVTDFLAAGGDSFQEFLQAPRHQILPYTVRDCLRKALERKLEAPTPLPISMLRRGRTPIQTIRPTP